MCFAAPNGSPQNAAVAVLDSNTVECSWLPPLVEEVNGVVTGFIIRVTGQDSDEMIELQTNGTNLQIESLHPFYSYVFTVAAVTEAGTGPFSPVVHFQMPTAGNELVSLHNTNIIMLHHWGIFLFQYPEDSLGM